MGERKIFWEYFEIALCVALLFVFLLIGSAASSIGEYRKKRALYNEAVTLVSAKLKAPGSAKFAPLDQCTIGFYGDSISGWVDSQNAFGALLRADWSLKTNYNGEREATVTEPSISGGLQR